MTTIRQQETAARTSPKGAQAIRNTPAWTTLPCVAEKPRRPQFGSECWDIGVHSNAHINRELGRSTAVALMKTLRDELAPTQLLTAIAESLAFELEKAGGVAESRKPVAEQNAAFRGRSQQLAGFFDALQSMLVEAVASDEAAWLDAVDAEDLHDTHRVGGLQ